MIHNDRRYRTAGFVHLIVLLLALVGAGCQQSTEPEDITISDVLISVKVADQGGRGIAGVEVRFAVGVANDTLVPFGRGRTAEDGIVSQTFSVPATGTVFTIEVEPPGGVRRRFDSVAIPCADFQFEVELPRAVTIPCGEQLPDEELALSLCAETRSADTICTALLDPLCPRPMLVSAGPSPIPIPGASLLMRINGAPQAGSSVTLNTGDRCEVCLVYRAQNAGSGSTQRVAVTGAPNGQPAYRLLNVDFTVESTCDSCACPAATTIEYPAEGSDTICVGETEDILVSLARVFNSNEACDLVFSLERQPVTPGLRIRSFNSGDDDLAPGSSLSPLRIEMTPVTAGPINESLVYTVRTRSEDGTLRECGRLTVNIHLVAVAPACPLLLSGSLIDNSGPGRTVPISQNVCDPGTGSFKTFCIRNPSTICAFTIENLRLSGLDESQFELDGARSFPIEIAPGGSECFEIRFKPTRAYYVASGNPPRSRFNANLTMSTTCGDSVLPITGLIPEPRIPPMRLFPVDCAVNPNTGIRTQADGAIVTDQQAGGAFLITVQSVTIGPGTKSAVLDITTQFRLLRTGLTDATPLCDLRFDPAARDACGNLGAAGLQTVREGEVYIFSYDYQGCRFCALLWVESIDDISVTRSCQQVQFRICSPLVY